MAQFLRFVLLAEIALYVSSVAWCRMVITLPWTVSLSAALLVPFGLRAFFILLTFRLALKHAEPSARWLDWCKAFISETLAPIAFLSIYGPFDKLLIRDSSQSYSSTLERPAKPLLIFVHGYVSNRGIWWRYIRAFKHRGYYVAAVDLSPPLASINDFVEQLHAFITTHRELTGQQRIILIAHSMGGLVGRAWQAKYEDQNMDLLITLGTPHAGTRLAPLALGECARQMQESSAWHRELKSREGSNILAKLISIRTKQDNVVIPNDSSVVPGATNISFRGVGHLAITTNQAIQEQVIGLVQALETQKA